MRRVILTAVLCSIIANVFAWQTKADTTRATKKGIKITIGIKDDDSSHVKMFTDSTSIKPKHTPSGFKFGLTLSRFDLGFATLIDNGSFTLSPQNSFLQNRFIKTSNVGFDIFQFGYRFNSNFRILLAAGVDWTNIRLEKNITILQNQPVLSYTTDNITYSKNRFSSKYLRLPLYFDYRSGDDKKGKKFHFVVGPEAGFLIEGKVKQISDDHGKQKFYDNYHFTRFEYGAVTRIGYGGFGLFAKYYFNDMFENSPQQQGLKNFSFGLMAGF
jgi:hypothetical protein